MHADRLSRTFLSKHEWWFLLVVFGLALGLRATYLLEIKDNPFFDHPRLDALFHDRWAQAIASGLLEAGCSSTSREDCCQTRNLKDEWEPSFLLALLAARFEDVGTGLPSRDC